MKQYTSIFAGIDVSKAHLDVYLHPTGASCRFDNDKKGWRLLRRWLTDAHLQGVVYEATGSYHKGVERYLGEHGFPIARLDPRRARRFAEALGVNVKTDPIDARVLAEFGAFLKPATRGLLEPALEYLKELVAARRGLVQQRTRIANKSKTVTSRLLKRQFRQSAKQIKRQIAEIDAECREVIRSDTALAGRQKILLSIPAIGTITAMTLLADMPELGNLNDKQAASLMGVAPVARDSGTFQGKRHIRGGRAQVRQAVYMAALVATRFNADMKRKYETLVRDGKPPKVALTVVMRKLIILANALIRDNRNWSEIRPCT
ncbi:MAG: IS110 family transposase [Rhodospirillaceae bacterium]|jgi:transposase|nr:IS110 family transposase [Rhodospirillaceae bacterium]